MEYSGLCGDVIKNQYGYAIMCQSNGVNTALFFNTKYEKKGIEQLKGYPVAIQYKEMGEKKTKIVEKLYVMDEGEQLLIIDGFNCKFDLLPKSSSSPVSKESDDELKTLIKELIQELKEMKR